MTAISLKVDVPEQSVTKVIQFFLNTTAYDACKVIREKITDTNLGLAKDYGLFIPGEDNSGVWMEPTRCLSFYNVKPNDNVQYRRKMRQLKVRMLDGAVKTLMVDDSALVAHLMVNICTKIGIMNHEEYSLVNETEPPELEHKPNYGTLTLKRKIKDGDKERDIKMENLKKKLKTDDEINWLDHGKTLREQGITENETVLLKRKYFFSDRNITSSDPVQLNLLYVQCRDAIVGGAHPVPLETACQFAGIQCQIQFGDYDENRHRAGFLDLKELLPQSYVKTKGVEKKIYRFHAQCKHKSELDAKVDYVELARSLSTYGTTFFLVKEKMKGKNKLTPRLLGVTKENVLRLDEKTKEIMKTWPLTTVRRWAASPNTFTLDFGDYSDSYYSVQTPEGEQISALIAGYIDIILKKRNAADHIGIEGDDGSAMLEDNVAPNKATIIQHQESGHHLHSDVESLSKPGIMIPGANGPQNISRGTLPGAKVGAFVGQVNRAHHPPSTQQLQITNVTLSKPQRALISTLESGREIITTCTEELDTKAELPELGSDPASVRWKQVTLDSSKQTVTSQIAAMNAATAEVVTLTSSVHDEVDHTAVGAAVHTITSNLPEMTRGVRMIAALLETDSESNSLLLATRSLCNAFSDLLSAAEPEKVAGPRPNLLGAASKVGEASSAVLNTIETGHHHQSQDLLLGLAKAVANTTAALILRAKTVAARCPDEQKQNRVITAATACALATSQLVACAKVVAPTLDNPACKEQVTAACREVGRAMQELLAACQDANNDPDLQDSIMNAAQDVETALGQLQDHVRTAGQAEVTQHDEALDIILTSSDKLIASHGNAAEMVRQAKILASATTTLIQYIKQQANDSADDDLHHRFLAAARQLADATTRLVEAAKTCAASPNDPQSQKALLDAADAVRRTTNSAASNALKKKIIKRLESAGKHAAAAATQCMAASQGAGPYNTSMASQKALITDCRDTADVIPRLVEAVKGTIHNSDDVHCQQSLLIACNAFLTPATKMASSVKAALPTVDDPATNLQLSNCNRQFVSALSELRSALCKAEEACGSGELENAMHICTELDQQLQGLQQVPANQPLPGETLQQAMSDVTNLTKTVGAGLAQLLTAASQNNQEDCGKAARDTASALQKLTNSARAVQATTGEPQESLISACRTVMQRCHSLLAETHQLMSSGAPPGSSVSQSLTTSARNVSQALNSTVGALPSNQAVDEAVVSIERYTSSLEVRLQQTTSTKSYAVLQEELTQAAHRLEAASADVVTAAKSAPHQLAPASKGMSNALGEVMGAGLGVASTQTQEVRGNIVISLKTVSTASSKLLTTAKSAASDSSSNKTALQQAARSLTDAINGLIDVCTAAAPGQNECDSAIRAIQATKSLLQSPSEPVSNASYYECLESVMERSKSLGDAMTGIANTAKNLQHENFSHSVKEASSAICGLVEAAAQAAYLVAISDPNSVLGRPGLVDQAAFARAYEEILRACQILRNERSEQQQVLSAATTIAKHTSALCNACRTASTSTSNPVVKRHFVQSAKDVANATASLVKEIKALDQDYSPSNRARCSQATYPMLEAVENLYAFANSPDYAAVPAKISPKARHAQAPITDAGYDIIDGACSMITSAKSLAVNPKDPPAWQDLATHSKKVSDSIKSLVGSIKDKAPGIKECDDSIDKLNLNIRNLDQTSLYVLDQNLRPRNDGNLQSFNEQVENAGRALLENIDKVRQAGKTEAEKLSHAVIQMTSYIDPMVNAAIGSASHMMSSKMQMSMLDQTKTVCECGLQLLYSCKESGGNTRASHSHTDLDDAADTMKETLQELLSTVESIATEAGVVSGLIESITTSMNRMGDRSAVSQVDESYSFVDYQTSMVAAAKEIARLSQEMVSKISVDPSQLGQLGASVAHQFNKLAGETAGAVYLSSTPDVATRLRASVHELGQSCITLIANGGACQSAPQDTYCQRDLAEAARHTSEKVVHVLAALQAGSQGTQACINAASTVSGIIGDLDTTIMFATAGTLNAENDDDCFSDHRENILKTAKALVEDTKTLVAGAASSQEQLAVAAQNAVSTIVQLAETVKNGAASLGANNPDAQVMLVNAVKDVAMALGDLIHATKAASGKSINDPAMTCLKESAKVMVTNVTSLLKTVKSVEDEHTRGTRALEATVEAIAQEIRAFDSSEAPKTRASPEELVKASKPITQATAKAVGAGNSGKQEDIIVAANMGRKAISDMLTTVKAAAWAAESHEVRRRVLLSGHDTAVQYRELLQLLLHNTHKPTTDSKQALSAASRKIATCVTDLVASAESLKAGFGWQQVEESASAGDDWEDPEDPTVIAENELLGAASSIDAAANKLLQLRPRRTQAREVDENLNFDEIILEACKSIAAATGALVKAAGTAQRELVDSGKVRRRPTAASDDGQWSEGLVSAARLVAAATHSLCEAANALVQGHATEEKLISAAKQVAGSTAQLLVACKVKADPNYASTQRLQAAGNAVKKATDNLVRAAQQAIQHEEEHTLIVNKRLVGGLAQEIDAREQVLRREKELMDARMKLDKIRQAKYRAGESGQSDTDGNMSGYDSPHETSGMQRTVYSSSIHHNVSNSTNGSANTSVNYHLTSPMKNLSLNDSRGSVTNVTTRTYKTAFTSNQSEPETSEVEDGPSFREALKAFQSLSSRAAT
ncbi:talin-2 isoform X3 [Hyalella azteca]|uniref:Talin-2 isoform X3 n=1 Tax=Hyalella azteca TaxID=294128 RepID=A0A8B7P774_HYAAZ|nr:talin-2 isoform X3 [Hyalella azteca]